MEMKYEGIKVYMSMNRAGRNDMKMEAQIEDKRTDQRYGANINFVL